MFCFEDYCLTVDKSSTTYESMISLSDFHKLMYSDNLMSLFCLMDFCWLQALANEGSLSFMAINGPELFTKVCSTRPIVSNDI